MKIKITNKKALEVIDELISHYRDEWEGTNEFQDVYPKYLEVRDFLVKALK